MRDEIIAKTVRLPIASGPEDISSYWTDDKVKEHEARVQAHMERVSHMVDAMGEKEDGRRRRLCRGSLDASGEGG